MGLYPREKSKSIERGLSLLYNVAEMTEQKEDYARHVDLLREGIVEDLVRAGRAPVMVPQILSLPKDGGHALTERVYCHIPPSGTLWEDTMNVSSTSIEFTTSLGEQRGKTVLRILKPYEAEIVKERRDAELRKVSEEAKREALTPKLKRVDTR
jgi:hypothetical protein